MRIEFKNGSVIECPDGELAEEDRIRAWEPNGPGSNIRIDPRTFNTKEYFWPEEVKSDAYNWPWRIKQRRPMI